MPPHGRKPQRLHWRVPSGNSSSHHLSGYLFLIVLLTRLQPADAAENVTQCEVEGFPGDKGRITCRFPLNLNETKKSFCLIHYEGGKKRADVVTACSWEGAKPLCVFEDGFRFYHPTIGTEFTVELPIKKTIGEFSCDTIPPALNVHVQKCRGNTAGLSGIKEEPLVNADVPAASNGTEQFSNSTGVSYIQNCWQTCEKPIIALGAIIGVLLLAIVILASVIVVLWVRFRRSARGSTVEARKANRFTGGSQHAEELMSNGTISSTSSQPLERSENIAFIKTNTKGHKK